MTDRIRLSGLHIRRSESGKAILSEHIKESIKENGIRVPFIGNDITLSGTQIDVPFRKPEGEE